MEIDLIRYHKKYKTEQTSNNSVYKKICKKFEMKGYPRISCKSIKYKYEKLISEPGRLHQLQDEASFVATESDDEINLSTVPHRQRSSVKKTYSSWDEDMEVLLLHLSMEIKKQHPAIPDNALFRRIVRAMDFEGYNITEHIVYYHHKKLKQNKEKLKYLTQKATELAKQKEKEAQLNNGYQHWSKSADAALLTYKALFQNQKPYLKPVDIWFNVMRQLEENGHGTFSEFNIKERYLSLINMERIDELKGKCGQSGLNIDFPRGNDKRNYLHWTDEMKEALMAYRRNLTKREASGELWEIIAKRMKDDGYGNFTALNVKYKYFNLKRQNCTFEKLDQREFESDEM